MPASSTLTTSAPRSARSSEQKPPGSSLVRSRTLTSLSGGSVTPGDPQHGPGLFDGRRATPDVLGHLPCLRDQLAVRARHVAVRQVEVVLEAGANVAAEREGRADEAPLVARDPDHLPVVRALGTARNLLRHERDVACVRPDAAVDADHERDVD